MSNLLVDTAGAKLTALRKIFALPEPEGEAPLFDPVTVQDVLRSATRNCSAKLYQLRLASPPSSPSSSPRQLSGFDPVAHRQAAQAYLKAVTVWHTVLRAMADVDSQAYNNLIKISVDAFNAQLNSAPLYGDLAEDPNATLVQEAAARVADSQRKWQQSEQRERLADQAVAEHEQDFNRRKPEIRRSVRRSLEAQFNMPVFFPSRQEEESQDQAADAAPLQRPHIVFRILRAIWNFLVDMFRFLRLWFSGKTVKEEQEEKEFKAGPYGYCVPSFADPSSRRRRDGDDDHPGRGHHWSNNTLFVSRSRGTGTTSSASSTSQPVQQTVSTR